MRLGFWAVHLESQLFIISKENFDGHPRIMHNLKPRLNAIQSPHFILIQLPPVKLEICFNPLRCDTFRNNTGASLEGPHEPIHQFSSLLREMV